jgi:hypothetical protein
LEAGKEKGVAMSKNFDSPIEVGFCGSEPQVQGLRPVEIVGNHWVHRDSSDKDAKFYLRSEVDLELSRLRDLLEAAPSFSTDYYVAERQMADVAREYLVRQYGVMLKSRATLDWNDVASYMGYFAYAQVHALVNTPETEDFFKGIELEAAHQRERWPSEQDAGKTDADWFWLVGYLAGKCLHAAIAGDKTKALHHTISTAASLANWHRALKGEGNMRPGIETPAEASNGG